MWCYRLGHGHPGMLGMDEYTPRVVEGLAACFVNQIAAGKEHTVVSTCDGEVWAFGKASYGRLGTGQSIKDAVSPVLVGVF